MGQYRALAVIGASHDISRHSRSQEDAAIGEKKRKYESKGLMPSCKFVRTEDSVPDENKFLMPVYGKVSSTAMVTLRSVMQGMQVAVVGSPQVCQYITLLRDHLAAHHGVPQDAIRCVPERERPRLAHTVYDGRNALGTPDKYLFIAGDIPLVDLEQLTQEYERFDPRSCAVLLDFNAKELIFPEVELFTRNYYARFCGRQKRGILSTLSDIIKGESKLYAYKEPNTYILSGRFDRWPVLNAVYDLRELGKLSASAALKIAWSRGLTRDDLHTITSLPALAADGAISAAYKLLTGNKVTTLEGFDRFASAIIGRQVQTAISHSDPFRLKDIDAWHDLIYYRELLRRASLDEILGSEVASAVEGFNEHLERQPQAIKEGLPLVYRFEEYAHRRTMELNMTEYLDENRFFVERTRPDERIDDSILRLRARRPPEKSMLISA